MKRTALLLLLSFFLTVPVLAHVTNERTVYSDIALSEAAPGILMLDLLGVISAEGGSQEFRPRDPLLASELAAWTAHMPEAEMPGITDGPQVDYELVNQVLFGGELHLEGYEGNMTREQFVAFTAAHADVEIGGESLISRAGFAKGPEGEITAVRETDGIYTLEVGGAEYPLGTHPRIAGEAVDPAVWEGMAISDSLLGPDVDDGQSAAGEALSEAIQYAMIGAAAEVPAAAEEPIQETGEVSAAEVAAAPEPEAAKEAGNLGWGTLPVVAAAVLFLYWLNRQKKQEIDQ